MLKFEWKKSGIEIGIENEEEYEDET